MIPGRRRSQTLPKADALTVAANGYKVFFLAFPVEAYGTAANRADLVARAFTWFGTP